MATVEFAGKEYQGTELTEKERDILFKHVMDYLAAEDAFLQSLFTLNKESIEAAAMVAKNKFDAPFNGILAADPQIGVSLIRPGHILRDTSGTETPINTWDSEGIQTGAFVSGSDNWIGYSTNNGTAVNIDKEALVVPMGLAFRQGQKPAVQEVRFQIGEVTYPVVVVDQAAFADNPNRVRAVRFHPLLMEPKQTVAATVWSETGGRQEMKLLGLTFGLGRFLRNTSYSSVST
jgi:hypothetical protein